MSKTRSKPTVARYRGAKSKSVRIVILLMSDGCATGPPQGGRPCEADPCGPAGCRSRKSRRDVKISPPQKMRSAPLGVPGVLEARANALQIAGPARGAGMGAVDEQGQDVDGPAYRGAGPARTGRRAGGDAAPAAVRPVDRLRPPGYRG